MLSLDQAPRTAERISMPAKSDKPGLKRGRRGLPYWIASQVTRDPMGFPDRCIPLPAEADDAALRTLCQGHTARLNAWIDERRAGIEPTMPRYDGSVYSACQLYQKHKLSRFHKVKGNTRRFYAASLEIIERTVGKRLIRNVTVLDVENWYTEWRKPTAEGTPERIDRAHDAVSMVRTILRFGAALRHKDCKQLAEELENIRFEKGGARDQELNQRQVGAFIRTAAELGQRGVIPPDRALFMSIGVAAQFELLLRQKDIIGEWRPDGTWSGQFAWENIPAWRWRMKTSKSKYRSAVEFRLDDYGMLFPLLELVPHTERQGAIVKGEGGLPVRESSYRKWFREIARAAGIPDEIWLMDSRAGGGGEAYDAGASLEDIQAAYTHEKPAMTLRYIRRKSKRIARVAEARNRSREEGGNDAG